MYVPWWAWLAAFAVVGLLAAEIGLGAPGLKTWLPYAILWPLTALGLWRLGRIEVAVRDGELRVDDAHAPLACVSGAYPLSGNEKRELLGPLAEPEAFVIQRPWIAGAVRIDIDDPADPTPYWLISTRHPAVLAAAVNAGRRANSPAAS
jgi:hypothetical protein